MIIILEGVDNSGKTTAACRLQSRGAFKPDMRWFDQSEAWKFDGASKLFEWERLKVAAELAVEMSNCGADIVFDRFHVSQMVYRSFDASGSFEANHSMFTQLCRKLDETSCVLLYMRPKSIEADHVFNVDDMHKHSELFMRYVDEVADNDLLVNTRVLRAEFGAIVTLDSLK